MKTKSFKSVYLLIGIGIGIITLPASGEIKKFAFQGTISNVEDQNLVLDGSIESGQTFEGFYIFDTSTPDSNGDSTVGDYNHTDNEFVLVVKVGDFVFRTNPKNVDFLIEVVNRPNRDNYLLLSYNNVCSKPIQIDHISWQLDDPSATAISDANLLIFPPDLNAWQSDVGLTISGGGGRPSFFLLRGHIGSISEAPLTTPEAPIIALNKAVEVKWSSELGYFYQIQSSVNLADWTDIGEPILGDGIEISRFFAQDVAKRFYRVVISNFPE